MHVFGIIIRWACLILPLSAFGIEIAINETSWEQFSGDCELLFMLIGVALGYMLFELGRLEDEGFLLMALEKVFQVVWTIIFIGVLFGTYNISSNIILVNGQFDFSQAQKIWQGPHSPLANVEKISRSQYITTIDAFPEASMVIRSEIRAAICNDDLGAQLAKKISRGYILKHRVALALREQLESDMPRILEAGEVPKWFGERLQRRLQKTGCLFLKKADFTLTVVK